MSSTRNDASLYLLRFGARIGFVLLLCFMLLAIIVVLGRRRAFPDVGDIVFRVQDVSLAFGNFDVYSIKPTSGIGKNLDQLFKPESMTLDPLAVVDCSRDGRFIIFFYAKYLFRLDVKTKDLVKITANPIDQISDAALSPDGRSFAFIPVFQDYNDEDVRFMTMSGTRPFHLPSTPYREYAVAWSADGSKLAFAASHTFGNPTQYTYLLEVMDAATQAITTIYETDLYIRPDIAWSPDGSQLAFSMSKPRAIVSNIYTIGLDGAPPQQLTNDGGFNVYPSWSPDGSLISYSSIPAGEDKYQLYVMDADGRDPYLVYWRLPNYNVFNECWLTDQFPN